MIATSAFFLQYFLHSSQVILIAMAILLGTIPMSEFVWFYLEQILSPTKKKKIAKKLSSSSIKFLVHILLNLISNQVIFASLHQDILSQIYVKNSNCRYFFFLHHFDSKIVLSIKVSVSEDCMYLVMETGIISSVVLR